MKIKHLMIAMIPICFTAGFWNPWYFGFTVVFALGYFIAKFTEQADEYDKMYKERFTNRKDDE